MAAEVRLANVSIPATIWRSVKAAKKTRTATKERITGHVVVHGNKGQGSTWRQRPMVGTTGNVVGLAIVSFQLFLRVGEATSLQPWAVVDDAVRFFDSKTRQAWQ